MSEEVSTHSLPHSTRPLGQAGLQVPEAQLTLPPVGGVHTLPQDPQLLTSPAVEVHTRLPGAPHTTRVMRPLGGQNGAQVPRLHVTVAPKPEGSSHTLPQAPQLLTSEAPVLMQVLPQSV